jgi:hypothetical protein
MFRLWQPYPVRFPCPILSPKQYAPKEVGGIGCVTAYGGSRERGTSLRRYETSNCDASFFYDASL